MTAAGRVIRWRAAVVISVAALMRAIGRQCEDEVEGEGARRLVALAASGLQK